MTLHPRVERPVSPTRPEPTPAPAIETILPDDVYAALDSQRTGLTAQQAATRLADVGDNTIKEEKRTPLWRRLFSHFTHVMALLLWIGGVVAFAAGLPELGVAIWLVNLINGVFSFWQEYRAEKATEALRRLLPVQATAIRDGVEARIPADQLVPGDVLLLDEGDKISADARLVQHAELRVDESALTGEAAAVRKSSHVVAARMANRAEVPNLVFAGTSVVSGRARAVVFATGMDTELGKISHLTQETGQDQSPLQQELGRLSYVVSVIAVSAGVVFFSIAIALGAMDLARGFVFALGMIVAFVPEGLLPTVTLGLAMGTQRMAKRNALVKKLSAVETLGSTTVICTDKTGTLTQNEMTVREIVLPGSRYTVSGVGYAPDGTIDPPAPGDDLIAMLRAAGLDTNARVESNDEGQWRVLGDPTEGAIRVACAKAGLDLAAEADARPRVHELPFDSVRKRMSTIHRDEHGPVLFAKGAPRELLALCTRVRRDGRVADLDDAERAEIQAANDELGRRGLRVLAVAMRELGALPADRTPATLERDLTYLGLVAMMDPPRPEVEAAVATCRRAGIRIIMITGDYGLTAETIARRVGIVTDGPVRIVNGDELEAMSEENLADALAEQVVFARVSPAHKLRVVSALQAMDEVVAVTGDGVNDAPALKKADIGVAMGLAGTDVAREAADMILLDDNFASIVSAVEEGRAVFANIRRFTSYIFTSNTPEAVPFIVFAFSAGRIPLAIDVMAILAIDLGTDLVPALALGAERPEPDVMDRPPRPRSEHIVTRSLLTRAYLWLGPLQAFSVMVAFFFVYWMNGYGGQILDLPDEGHLYAMAAAMALAAVVATQVGNLFAQRADRMSIFEIGFFSNRLVWIGILSEIVVIFLIVYTPFLQNIIGTAALPASYWLWLLPLTPVLLVADETRKWIKRRTEELT